MTNTLVSVVIPTFNDDLNFFSIALESIINQTYSNLEILIIDGSTNSDIKNFITKYNDGRIKYLYREKNGIADALNFGVSNATGDYIARMDADDISKNNRIEKQVSFLNKNVDIDILGSSYEVINDDGIIVEQRLLHCSHDEIRAQLIFENGMCHPTVMFRKSFWNDGLKYRQVFAEDYDLWTTAILHRRFANLSDCLFLYRKHENSTSSVQTARVCSSDERSAQEYINKLFNIDTEDFNSLSFVRNYHFDFRKEEIINLGYSFFEEQYKLLSDIKNQNAKQKIIDEKYLSQLISIRWKKLMQIANISSLDNIVFSGLEFDKLQLLNSAIEKLHTLASSSNNFYIYGLGEQGKRILDQCNSLISDNRFTWTLLGGMDARNTTFSFADKNYTSITIDSDTIDKNAYFVISSLKYYDEIKEKLIETGIRENQIINDSFIYYM